MASSAHPLDPCLSSAHPNSHLHFYTPIIPIPHPQSLYLPLITLASVIQSPVSFNRKSLQAFKIFNQKDDEKLAQSFSTRS